MSQCPVCNSDKITVLMEIQDAPVHCNLLLRTKAQATEAARGTLRLGFCGACTHTFNTAFEPDLMRYSPDYENALEFSPRFESYISELASQLVERYRLTGKRITEIGCGSGAFLRLLCERAGATGVGVDPGCRVGTDDGLNPERITYIRDLYSERYASYEADFICCRHTLEHIYNPVALLTTLRQAIGERTQTAVFFEVPNALFTFRDLSIWDLIYEHYSYFTRRSLGALFSRCGFAVASLTESFGEEFLCIEAVPDRVDVSKTETATNGVSRHMAGFAERYRNKLEAWRHKLARARQAGKRVVVWGAGSKGTMFLNTIGEECGIEYIVDINPYKEGMYVTGAGQRIVRPDFLRSYQPDVVIIMNSIYESEIRELATSLGLTSEFECA